MSIAASTGLTPAEQGIAGGMASATLGLGNAVRPAALTALADAGTEGVGSRAPRVATADGEWRLVLLTALGTAAGPLALLRPPRGRAGRSPRHRLTGPRAGRRGPRRPRPRGVREAVTRALHGAPPVGRMIAPTPTNAPRIPLRTGLFGDPSTLLPGHGPLRPARTP
ncbi:hypothetical protein [Streptomyces sp. NPDC018347]|uniref:hypothetical protein n=1 Tax=Streptomyces sp. NPDC018347 TaxID=3157193 RepID=UPI0033CF5A82